MKQLILPLELFFAIVPTAFLPSSHPLKSKLLVYPVAAELTIRQLEGRK